MRIRLLGTGTPTPSLRRMCSGYVVEIGSDVIVLDHGFGAHHRLLELGIHATRVSHLFFTHLHYDHCGDYARLVLTRWDQGAGRVPDLKVYGPPPLARMSEQLFGKDGVYDADLVARTSHGCSLSIYEARGGALPRRRPDPRVTELKLGDVVSEGEWTLEVGNARHFQPYLVDLRLPSAARRPHVRLLGRQRTSRRDGGVRPRRRCAGAHVPSYLRHRAQRGVSQTPAWATWSSRTWRRGLA